MAARSFEAGVAEGLRLSKILVRAEGVEPSRAFAGPTDFHATSAFAAAAILH